jgi:2-oxoglutarate dehydrogenase E2 component (dihydrolipoamide succinyltransferase)
VPAGDLVKEDDVLLQIETDKVTIDVRYTESEPGTLTEYLCKEDDTVTVGQEVVKVDKGQHTCNAST